MAPVITIINKSNNFSLIGRVRQLKRKHIAQLRNTNHSKAQTYSLQIMIDEPYHQAFQLNAKQNRDFAFSVFEQT